MKGTGGGGKGGTSSGLWYGDSHKKPKKIIFKKSNVFARSLISLSLAESIDRSSAGSPKKKGRRGKDEEEEEEEEEEELKVELKPPPIPQVRKCYILNF